MRSVVVAVAALVAVARPAAAQSSEADRLFDEGRTLMTSGHAEEACPKFERSQQLDPGRGTLINLAACYEATGKLVEALAGYEEVIAQSQAAKPVDKERLAAATKLIEKLRPRIPQLAFALEGGGTVTVDGAAVDADQPLPVDPGTHAIEVSAPGHESWKASVEVGEGERQTVTVPALAESNAHPAPPPPPPRLVRNHTRTVLSLSVAGGGVALFGVSVLVALSAKGKYDDALDAHCGGDPNGCDAAGVEATRSARSRGNLATIIGGAGLVAVAAGVIWYLTSPLEPPVPHETALVPQLSADSAGVALVGSF